MNKIKNVILIFPFLLFSQISLADCGHCFSIIKVKIIYNNGEEEISHLKFFRQYILDNDEIAPQENEAIKRYFPKNHNSIQLIDSIYQIKNLPAFIDDKDERIITLQDVKDIYLLEYTSIQGAFELPHLSSESIERIIKSDTFHINTKIFSVHDEVYIYTGTKLSVENFNFLINESYNYSDLEPSILGGLNINYRKNIYPDKAELNKAFNIYFEEIKKKICNTAEVKISPKIDEYFRIYNANLKTREEYLELVFDYLNTSKTIELKTFISCNVANDYHKNLLLQQIDKDPDIIKNTIGLVSSLFVFKEDHILSEEFYNVLKAEEIIVLPVSWD